ncbi:MAG TPA: response regulator transcription factor [Rectinemataceae bacterium]|nr:response regulator transcription factor [Rectinemataceae bacterium]
MAKRILIVEDEEQLSSLVADYLHADGFEAEVRADGRSGLEAALAGGFDLVLLDVMLPLMDGFEVCRALRAESDIPVLMLTALREDGDKIRALGLGADDYVTKPFSPAELVARIRSHLARYDRLTGRGEGAAERWFRDGKIEVNQASRRVRRDGSEVALTAKEFELLLLFMRNADRVFAKDDIYERLWGEEHYGESSTVAVHIRRLREKIEDDPSEPRRIETVWGMGYRWKGGL